LQGISLEIRLHQDRFHHFQILSLVSLFWEFSFLWTISFSFSFLRVLTLQNLHQIFQSSLDQYPQDQMGVNPVIYYIIEILIKSNKALFH
jgi:hypothetical protein